MFLCRAGGKLLVLYQLHFEMLFSVLFTENPEVELHECCAQGVSVPLGEVHPWFFETQKSNKFHSDLVQLK